MRVLAAAFREEAAATRVLHELRRRYDVDPADASIAPLGSADRRRQGIVLAGRFRDDVVLDVRRVVTDNGGEVVSEVDERWTRSPAAHEALEEPGTRGPN